MQSCFLPILCRVITSLDFTTKSSCLRLILEALFEASVLVEGKRERKKTERLSITATTEKKVAVIPEGTGVKLEDIPYTAAVLRKQKSEDLNLLHRACYSINGEVCS